MAGLLLTPCINYTRFIPVLGLIFFERFYFTGNTFGTHTGVPDTAAFFINKFHFAKFCLHQKPNH